MSGLHFTYQVPGDDFTRAGEASGAIKSALKKLGLPPQVVRRVAMAMFGGVMNMVIPGGGGVIAVGIADKKVLMVLPARGPGIPDIAKAMEEGWSTAPDNVRSLGFGAGMGLPNMKKYTDEMKVESAVGEGTTVTMAVYTGVSA